jgi:homoserine kinase
MLFSAKYSSFANTWFWEIYTHMRFPCGRGLGSGSASLIAADRAEGRNRC